VKVSIILSIFKAERYLERYFEEALQQKGIDNIEFSIVHNNPTRKEKEIISAYRDKLKIVYQSVELESIYQSWNRAIAQSSGEYLACWNVDDLRNYDSIYEMQKTLDNDESVGFTYGDIVIVNRFGKKVGRYVKTKKFTDHLGTTGAIGGPFFMWRKNLVDKIGFFDEQFKSGSDFDYTVRLSIFSRGMKTNGLIGYFLNNGSGLSTKSTELQVLERTAIQLRYGIWHTIDINYINKALDYQINLIKENNISRKADIEIRNLAESRQLWILLVLYSFIKIGFLNFLQKVKKLFK